MFTARYGLNFLSSLTCEVARSTSSVWVRFMAEGEPRVGGVDNFLSEYFGFPLSLSFYQNSILILIYMLFFENDDQAKAPNALICDTVSEIEEYWIARSFTF